MAAKPAVAQGTLDLPPFTMPSSERIQTMNPQGEFDFEAAQDESDYTKWLTGHKVAVRELSQRLGLPIGREAEVWLTGGVRLRGKLRLKEEVLVIEEESVRHLELQIAGVPFALREMESCVRLD